MKKKNQEPKTKKIAKKVTKTVKKDKGAVKLQSMEELLSSSGYKIHGLKKGEFIEGTVTEIRPKTLFIDIGSKTEGIITGKELGLVKDFASQLKIGSKVLVQVRVPENDKGQTLLSLRKAAFERSWDYFKDAVKDGKTIEVLGREVNHGGTVVTAPFGLFGFIPGSQIGNKYQGDPVNLVSQKVMVKVLEVDREKNRLVFSERMVSEPDRVEREKAAVTLIKLNDKFEAEVVRVEPFGLFIRVDYTVGKEEKKNIRLEGLVHISEISWEKVEDLTKMYHAGNKVEVCLVNKEGDKLQFSIKRLKPDPWSNIEEKYPKDNEIKGIVTQITNFGALVRLEPGIEGLIHVSKIPPQTQLKVGETVNCFIEHVDKNSRRLSLELALKEKPIGYK